MAVVTPAILTLSRFVWPSTSKSPLTSIPPVTVTSPLAAFTKNLLAALVISLIAKEPWRFCIIKSGFAFVSLKIIPGCEFSIVIPVVVVKYPSVANVAFPPNVVTPATLTLSKFVWPSTSKSVVSNCP